MFSTVLRKSSRDFHPAISQLCVAEDSLPGVVSHCVTKPVEPSLNELYRYNSETKVASQFHRWYAISAPHGYNVVDAAIVKDRKQ